MDGEKKSSQIAGTTSEEKEFDFNKTINEQRLQHGLSQLEDSIAYSRLVQSDKECR